MAIHERLQEPVEDHKTLYSLPARLDFLKAFKSPVKLFLLQSVKQERPLLHDSDQCPAPLLFPESRSETSAGKPSLLEPLLRLPPHFQGQAEARTEKVEQGVSPQNLLAQA